MKKALIVDRDQTVLCSIGETLKELGYSVTPCFSGRRAIAEMNPVGWRDSLADRRPRWNDPMFHLVVAELPVRPANGLLVLREAKRRFPLCATILMTDKIHGGHLDKDDPPDGIGAILFKPFDSPALEEAVKRAVSKMAAILASAQD